MDGFMQNLRQLSPEKIKSEIKWLWGYIKRYRLYVVLSVVLGFAATVFGLGGSVLSKNLINAVTSSQQQSLKALMAAYVGFGLISIVLNALLSRVSALSNSKVTRNMRTDVYSRVIAADWTEFSHYHSGDVLNRVNSDVGTVSSGMLTWMPTLVTKTFQFACAFLLLLHYDPVMALIALASSPMTVLATALFLFKLRDRTKAVKQASAQLVSFLGESFREITNIKAFDLLEDFTGRFRLVQSALTTASLNQNLTSIASSLAVSLCGMLASCLFFGFSIYRLWKNQIDFGTLAMFLQLSSVLSGAFSAAVSLMPSVVNSFVSAQRIMEITNLTQESRDDEQTAKFLEQNRDAGVRVEISGAAFSYEGEDRPVFTGADAVAEPGEVVGFIGCSGSGKTTVLRLLLGLIQPSDGAACLVGQKTGQRLLISSKTRKAFAYVPQGRSVFTGTVAQNLRMAKSDATDEQLIEALKIACAYDFVMQLPQGLNSYVGESASALSEGQAQRISIARAVLSDAPVLIMDESTSALDERTQDEVMNNLHREMKNRTCIVTTHKKSVMRRCSRLYLVGQDGFEQITAEKD